MDAHGYFVGEEPPQGDGYIEPPKPRDQVRQDPYPLPKDFEWATLDVGDASQVYRCVYNPKTDVALMVATVVAGTLRTPLCELCRSR